MHPYFAGNLTRLLIDSAGSLTGFIVHPYFTGTLTEFDGPYFTSSLVHPYVAGSLTEFVGPCFAGSLTGLLVHSYFAGSPVQSLCNFCYSHGYTPQCSH